MKQPSTSRQGTTSEASAKPLQFRAPHPGGPSPVVPARRRTRLVVWDLPGPRRSKSISLWPHEHFSARGMRPVYGRGDHFGVVTCKMDIWVRRNGQVLVRFWSPRQTLEQFSYEVRGLSLGFSPKGTVLLDEDCVPEILRDAYDEWVRECLDYPWD